MLATLTDNARKKTEFRLYCVLCTSMRGVRERVYQTLDERQPLTNALWLREAAMLREAITPVAFDALTLALANDDSEDRADAEMKRLAADYAADLCDRLFPDARRTVETAIADWKTSGKPLSALRRRLHVDPLTEISAAQMATTEAAMLFSLSLVD